MFIKPMLLLTFDGFQHMLDVKINMKKTNVINVTKEASSDKQPCHKSMDMRTESHHKCQSVNELACWKSIDEAGVQITHKALLNTIIMSQIDGYEAGKPSEMIMRQ